MLKSRANLLGESQGVTNRKGLGAQRERPLDAIFARRAVLNGRTCRHSNFPEKMGPTASLLSMPMRDGEDITKWGRSTFLPEASRRDT